MTESLTTNCGLSVLDHLVTSGTFSLDGGTWELVLDPDTVVHTGHGDSTTIGAEAPHLDEWIARGH